MSHDLLTFNQQNIRGTDSNSLLRMYDRAQDVFANSLVQLDRTRAEKAIERIATELRKRKVPMMNGSAAMPVAAVSMASKL